MNLAGRLARLEQQVAAATPAAVEEYGPPMTIEEAAARCEVTLAPWEVALLASDAPFEALPRDNWLPMIRLLTRYPRRLRPYTPEERARIDAYREEALAQLAAEDETDWSAYGYP